MPKATIDAWVMMLVMASRCIFSAARLMEPDKMRTLSATTSEAIKMSSVSDNSRLVRRCIIKTMIMAVMIKKTVLIKRDEDRA